MKILENNQKYRELNIMEDKKFIDLNKAAKQRVQKMADGKTCSWKTER